MIARPRIRRSPAHRFAIEAPETNVGIDVSYIGGIYFFITAFKIALTALFFRDNPKLGTAVDGGLVVGMLYVLAMLVLARAVTVYHLRIGAGAWAIAAFLAWSGLSLRWTAAHPLSSTLGYWSSEVIALITIAFLVRITTDIHTMAIRCLQGFVLGSLSVMIIALLTGMRDGSGRLGDSAFLHPNTLGNALAIAGILSIYLMLRPDIVGPGHWTWILTTGLCAIGLLLTLSKTSIAAFVFGVTVFLLFGKVNVRAKIALFGAAALAALVASGFLASYWDAYVVGDRGRSLTTLTGRTKIWEATIELIQRHPITGYGYLSFRDVGPQIAAVRLVHAHNEVLTLLFNLGIIGLVLGALCYLLLTRSLWRANRRARTNPRDAYGALGLALMAFMLVRGITEADTTGLLFPSSFMLLFLAWGARPNLPPGMAPPPRRIRLR